MYRPTEGEGTSAGEGRGDPAVDLPQQAQTILVTVRCRVHRVQDPDPDGAGLDEEPAPGHEALGALDRDGDDPAPCRDRHHEPPFLEIAQLSRPAPGPLREDDEAVPCLERGHGPGDGSLGPA